MRLKIELPNTWVQQDNPDGPATFARQGSSAAFQVSWAEYKGGKPPEVTADGLKQMAINFGQKQNLGDSVEFSTGPCRFGTFGTAAFRTKEFPRFQIWFISNGSDHIMATHICDQEPSPKEVLEAQQIANSLALGQDSPTKPKWRFW